MLERFATPVCIESPLSINEVHERLQSSCAGLTNLRIKSPFQGSVCGDSCELIASGGGRDLQKRVLRLSFDPMDGGTRLSGEFAVRPVTAIFGVVWFGFVTSFFVGALASRFHGNHDDMPSQLVWTPLGMLVFGVLLALILSRLGRWYERRIVRSLESLLDGKEIVR
jgi:hypothetical protein